MPHVMHAWHDITVHPILKALRLTHINDRLRTREQEPAADARRDIAHQLAAIARDFAIVVGREAAEEHRPKGKVDDELVDNAGDE